MISTRPLVHRPGSFNYLATLSWKTISMRDDVQGIKVYVAGPITLGNTAFNIRQGLDAANKLLEAGCYPYVPHLSHFWDLVHPHRHEEWMALDKAWLNSCGALIRLPGSSKGADQEVVWAHRLYLPVYLSVDSFFAGEASNHLTPRDV